MNIFITDVTLSLVIIWSIVTSKYISLIKFQNLKFQDEITDVTLYIVIIGSTVTITCISFIKF